MTNIRIYDRDAEKIERIAEENDDIIADVVEEMILCYLETMKNDL